MKLRPREDVDSLISLINSDGEKPLNEMISDASYGHLVVHLVLRVK